MLKAFVQTFFYCKNKKRSDNSSVRPSAFLLKNISKLFIKPHRQLQLIWTEYHSYLYLQETES